MKRSSPWLRWMWPSLVGILVLGVTFVLWTRERQADERNLRSSFDFALRQTATRVEERIAGYEQMLRGARGLFDAAEKVSESDFAHYVEALLGGADFAGLRTIAYAPLRADGTAPIAYMAPAIASTRGEIGDDPLTDPERREEMLQARDSGSTAITRRLPTTPGADPAADALVQMFIPLYKRNRDIDTVAMRREHLRGWVFASFRVADLMSSLYGEGTPGLEVRVHDGVRLSPSTLMYSNALVAQATRPARFEAQEYIGFAGHTWTLSVRSTPAFEQRFSNDSARIIGVAGSGLALLLALLTWLLATSRMRALATARAMTRQLRESTERYQRIVETADEGIWTVDDEAAITFINPKMEQMLGWRAEELIGRRWTDLVPEEDRASIEASATADPSRKAQELRLRRKDGASLWVTLTTSSVRDARGLDAGTLAMVTDITERKQAEAKRTLLEEQLRQSQKMEAIGTLAGGIAHDFNNILAAILGNVSLAQNEIEPEHAATPRLQQIAQAGSRARSLVQQIVAFSRQQPQELLVQPLTPLLDETLKLLRSTLPAQVELEPRIADPSLAIEANATQLQQVLMNLCTNAWHAMRGSPGHIVLGLDEVRLDEEAAARLGDLAPGRHAHLWVSDSGCGMDEATRARVFEPFFTTKPVGQGTGLGLSVVHGIVTSHHGAITVTSSPGQGSTFDMYFPLARTIDETVAATTRALAEPAGAPRGRGQHVLYVDDDPVMLVMVEGLLQAAGYRVSCTEDARLALQRVLAADADFDVLVTDFNMPELSGMDLARELAQQRPGLPVVITSGYVSDGLRAEAQQAGVRHVMQKEYTLEQLQGLLHRVLLPINPG